MRPLGTLLALLLLGPSCGFFTPAPRLERAPSSIRARRSHRQVPVVELSQIDINAFEVPDMMRAAAETGRRVFNGVADPVARAQAVAVAWRLVEPLDLLMIAGCYALARKDWLLRRFPRRERCFVDSFWHSLAPMARATALLVWPLYYASDCVCTLLSAAGVLGPEKLKKIVTVEMSVGYAYITARLLLAVKSFILRKMMPTNKCRAQVFDHLGDIFCWMFVVGGVLEKLSFELGFSLKSVLAFSGGGAVVLGLACQTPLENLVSGILIGATNPFGVGDEVDLGEGVEGYIESVGWYQTKMRGYDGRLLSVPNAVFASRTTVNFSRCKTYMLKTTVKLQLEDLPKMIAVVDELRSRLAALRDTVVDGSRNFWVHLVDVTGESAQIAIQVHYAGSDESAFREWKEFAMLEIAAAVGEKGARYAVPLETRLTLEQLRELGGDAGGATSTVAAAREVWKERSPALCEARCELDRDSSGGDGYFATPHTRLRQSAKTSSS